MDRMFLELMQRCNRTAYSYTFFRCRFPELNRYKILKTLNGLILCKKINKEQMGNKRYRYFLNE